MRGRVAGMSASDAPAGRGHLEAAVWWILAALLGRVIRGELRLRVSS
jgi:hypothetical protein